MVSYFEKTVTQSSGRTSDSNLKRESMVSTTIHEHILVVDSDYVGIDLSPSSKSVDRGSPISDMPKDRRLYQGVIHDDYFVQ